MGSINNNIHRLEKQPPPQILLGACERRTPASDVQWYLFDYLSNYSPESELALLRSIPPVSVDAPGH